MRCGCIDIGSNTTRLLVADVEAGRLEPVLTAKAFTRLGRELRRTGALAPATLDQVATVVAGQLAAAREAGAERVRVVATAAIRLAANGPELRAAVRARAGVDVDVLAGGEEARIAFQGAVRTHAGPLEGTIAVVDIGGGSSEVAVGTAAGGVRWSTSLPVGSGTLAEACLRSDPPGADELGALRARAAAAFAGLDVPAVDHALAVGGSATSTSRLLGRTIAAEAVADALDALCGAPSVEVAREHGLEPERVSLLPAGLHLLAAAAERLGCPLEVGCGGLREGVCLELA